MTSALDSLSAILGTPSAFGVASTAPVARTSNTGLVQAAVDLSSSASIVATFGSTKLDLPIYNPAGLLNSIVQAGTVSTLPKVPPAGTNTQTITQQAADKRITGTLPSNAITSGIYTRTGILQSLPPSSVAADWARVLRTNPGLSGTVIGDAVAQGIVSSLHAIA